MTLLELMSGMPNLRRGNERGILDGKAAKTAKIDRECKESATYHVWCRYRNQECSFISQVGRMNESLPTSRIFAWLAVQCTNHGSPADDKHTRRSIAIATSDIHYQAILERQEALYWLQVAESA
eukprot:scaffold6369_cov77-Skeletonema_dohrnii-CCMP3373.AAC.2